MGGRGGGIGEKRKRKGVDGGRGKSKKSRIICLQYIVIYSYALDS